MYFDIFLKVLNKQPQTIPKPKKKKRPTLEGNFVAGTFWPDCIVYADPFLRLSRRSIFLFPILRKKSTE